MGKKNFKTTLRYQASRDGWMESDFHRLCDGEDGSIENPTVSLFKINDNNNCIGGFTSA